jgi:DNA-binding protein HU-beta
VVTARNFFGTRPAYDVALGTRRLYGAGEINSDALKRGRYAVNKAELVNRVSDSVEGGRSAAQNAVEAVFDAIQEAVARGEKVAITGFGVFERVDRAARTGRNPATGEPVEVEASSVPKFRPGSEFKAYVSGAKEFTRGVVTSAREAAALGARAVGDALAPEAAAASVKPARPSAQKAATPAKKATKTAAAKKAAAKKAPAKRA